MAEILRFLLYILLGQIFFLALWILTLNLSDCNLACLLVLPWKRPWSTNLSCNSLLNVSNSEIYALPKFFCYKQIIFQCFNSSCSLNVTSCWCFSLNSFQFVHIWCEVTEIGHSACFFFYKEKSLNKKRLCLVCSSSLKALERAASSHCWFSLVWCRLRILFYRKGSPLNISALNFFQ